MTTIKCNSCMGEGKVYGTNLECPVCCGTGKVWKEEHKRKRGAK
jgi:RecJ-like exonuclease